MESNSKQLFGMPSFASMEDSKTSFAARSGGGSYSKLANQKGSGLTAMLNNIDDGLTPFERDSDQCFGIKEAVVLMQKAYYNVSIIKMTIDTQTEFANSKVHFIGENKSAVKFFEQWYDTIGGYNLADQFFRELFRSSNVFLYRVDSILGGSSIDIYGPKAKRRKGKKIPIRYIVLNPAEIKCKSHGSFVNTKFIKLLTSEEAAQLKSPKTPEMMELKRGLPADVRRQIDDPNRRNEDVKVDLDPDRLSALFYKKQDYEPFAVPLYFPVLYDVNLKLEFKKAESVIARTVDYVILLITMGDKENGVNQEFMNAMTTMFQNNESVGRVMVADYTTDMEFVIPDLNKILGPTKYEAVNRDIANGLMNIFFSENKFSDSMAKIKIFLERLKEARKLYLNKFLIPEMKRVCKELGFKECPTPVFEDVDLKDDLELKKIYNRLAELGLLTPEELFEAYKTNQMPTGFDSEESQRKYKALKKKGYYEPSGGGDAVGPQAGRPTGTPQKQKPKTPSPVGEKGGGNKNTKAQFSTNKLGEVVKLADDVFEKAMASYKEKHDIQRLSKKQRPFVFKITEQIIANEKPENWLDKVDDYVAGKFDFNAERAMEIAAIEEEHQVEGIASALLLHSKVEDIEEEKV